MQANPIQLPQHNHHVDGRVIAASAAVLTAILVWALSGLHFDNQALDAVPATASLARDIGVGIGAIVWQPLAALAAVLLTALLIVAIGRATMGHTKAA